LASAFLTGAIFVGSTLAMLAGGRPRPATESRLQLAVAGCQRIKYAAELYSVLEGPVGYCPTLGDLVRAKKITVEHTIDPWGTPYVIRCAPQAAAISVLSAGRDHVLGTADDVHDAFTHADMDRASLLDRDSAAGCSCL
jgi:hypothetical protein